MMHTGSGFGSAARNKGQGSTMTETPKTEPDPEAIIDAMAPLLGLTVTPEYKPGIVTNLSVTAGLAKLILEFALDDHAEPAAVFRP